MSNVKTAWGLCCPKCGDDDCLVVTFTGTAHLTASGTDDCGDHEWTDDSAINCGCGHSGTVKDFAWTLLDQMENAE